jgi:hypothetical protein
MKLKEGIENCIGNVLLMMNPGKVKLYKDDELIGYVILFDCLNEEHKEKLLEYCFYYSLCPKWCTIKCLVNGTELKKYSYPETHQIIDRELSKYKWSE